MEICNPSCGSAIPINDWSKGCDVTYRPGGIPYLIFLKCDPDLVYPNPPAPGQTDPLTNLDNVKWAICQGILHVSPNLLGKKDKGSFTKRRITSCGPEQTISGTQTIGFQDFNADPDLTDFEWWNAIVANKKYMSLGWITCDELVYKTDAEWDIEIGDVIEDTKDGMNYKDGIITISEKELITPVSIPGIIDVLKSYLVTESCYS
jgi:hypothetical protein